MNTVKYKNATKTDKIMTKIGFGYSQISSLVLLSVICPWSAQVDQRKTKRFQILGIFVAVKDSFIK